MAIGKTHLDMLDFVRREISLKSAWPLNTLCLSVPDILVSTQDLGARYSNISAVLTRSDTDQILTYHGLGSSFGVILDTRSFFEHLGLSPTFIDVKRHRGYEQLVDLNEHFPERYNRSYDLVLDSGTLEHCFNVGVAFRNMCDAVRLGGFLITTAPISMVNHGFYNFCPTLYVDGLTDNGFEIVFLGIASKNQVIRLEPSSWLSRMNPPTESVLHCLAKRVDSKEFTWPTQTKYKGLL